MASSYLVLAGVKGVADGDLRSSLVYVVAAVVTFAFAAAVLPIMAPRRPGNEGGPGKGGPGDGGDEPEPPWWPDFERDFRRHAALPDQGDTTPAESPAREKAPAGA